jgi:hypothetical protein
MLTHGFISKVGASEDYMAVYFSQYCAVLHRPGVHIRTEEESVRVEMTTRRPLQMTTYADDGCAVQRESGAAIAIYLTDPLITLCRHRPPAKKKPKRDSTRLVRAGACSHLSSTYPSN